MRISVIIPTYNRADLIAETLDAVIAQTHPPAEVIIVDDGSQDGTSDVLARHYPDLRVIRIANSGDMVARNIGLRAATGELAAFCDSDDLWRPDHLATMVGLWAGAPGLRFAFANFALVQDGVWRPGGKFADAPDGFWAGGRSVGADLAVYETPFVERLLRFQPFFPSALVADRAWFLTCDGWDEAVSRMIGCDFATALRLVERPPFGVVTRPTVGVRKHAGNISADVQAMNLGDSLVLEHVLTTRRSLAPYADSIRLSILARRRAAFETAFARLDLTGARRISALLPPRSDARLALKRAVVSLPDPLDRWSTSLLTGLGTRLGSTGKTPNE